jgi:uncharacterized protein
MKSFSLDSLRVNVDRISNEGHTLRIVEKAERFSGLKEEGLEEEVEFLSPIDMEIRLRKITRFVEASGLLQTLVRFSCSRCLRVFSSSLFIPFEATYAEALQASQSLQEEAEIELTADAINLFPFHGRQIDLAEAIQEQVIMALPVRPLCCENCKGLCQKCGADLNQGACECAEKPKDPRFAALKDLKINKK